MLAYIVLLWVIMKLDAPLWCYLLVVGAILIRTAEMILHYTGVVLEKKLKELEDARNDMDTL